MKSAKHFSLSFFIRLTKAPIYNFIKPHNSIGGLTPAEMAGIGVENNENKWEELLKRSMKTTHNATKKAF